MKAFYPVTTPEIIHKGTNGNIYRLDSIEKCVDISTTLKSNQVFEVAEVSTRQSKSRELAKSLIKTVHNASLIDTYESGSPESVANSSGLMWQPKLYNFVLEQALTSKFVVDEALINGGSLAITVGGHHAEIETPFGFCPINTMAIAAKYASAQGLRVAVIDLDTHYSNGCIDILRGLPNINLFSLWNQTLDKWKYFENPGNIWHKKVTTVEGYFSKLSELVAGVNALNPDFVIYHFGCDILASDRMGGVLGMTEEKLLERDEIVRKLIQLDLKCKFAIFLGGAYVDRTKGIEYAENLKKNINMLTEKVLSAYANNIN